MGDDAVFKLQAMLERALDELSPRNAGVCLFNYLRDLAPFEHLVCYAVDRNSRSMSIVMDYSPDARAPEAYPVRRKTLVPFDALEKARAEAGGDIYLMDAADSPLAEAYLRDFPYSAASALLLLFRDDRESNASASLVFLHRAHGVFTEEHRANIALLRDVIVRVANRLLAGHGDACLALNADGALPASPDAMLRRCPGLAGVMARVDAVAPTDGHVLITGPTGVGKELVAEAIHALSPRRRGPLVRVNCGAIPDSLLDAELFGYEKGAFTGAAAAHPGYFEQADHGAIYLDEVGELPMQAQVRLLRALDAKEIRRIGGTRRIDLDIRVIAATHRDLRAMTEEGLFREDLWYRLNVFPLAVPPLGARPEDIPVLTRHFYTRYVAEQRLDAPPALTPAFLRDLGGRPWRGNVRELRYLVERSILFGAARKEKTLRPPEEERMPKRRPGKAGRERVLDALARAHGRIQGKNGAAALLGLSPSTLRDHMKKLGIPLPGKRE